MVCHDQQILLCSGLRVLCGCGTGRKSGIWQGSTEVELKQLERQWDDYKVAPHTLGMPWS